MSQEQLENILSDVRKNSLLIGKKVKVINPQYILGGYEGVVIGCTATSLLLDCPLEQTTDCWEATQTCKLIE